MGVRVPFAAVVVLVAIPVFVSVPSCGGPSRGGHYEETDAGTGAGPGPGGAGGQTIDARVPADTAPRSFANDVWPILKKYQCSVCHFFAEHQSGLDLFTAKNAYVGLVDKPTTNMGCMNKLRVVPGEPDKSFLIDKLRGPNRLCPQGGAQMPRAASGTDASQVVVEHTDLVKIEDWIREGAKDN